MHEIYDTKTNKKSKPKINFKNKIKHNSNNRWIPLKIHKHVWHSVFFFFNSIECCRCCCCHKKWYGRHEGDIKWKLLQNTHWSRKIERCTKKKIQERVWVSNMFGRFCQKNVTMFAFQSKWTKREKKKHTYVVHKIYIGAVNFNGATKKAFQWWIVFSSLDNSNFYITPRTYSIKIELCVPCNWSERHCKQRRRSTQPFYLFSIQNAWHYSWKQVSCVL